MKQGRAGIGHGVGVDGVLPRCLRRPGFSLVVLRRTSRQLSAMGGKEEQANESSSPDTKGIEKRHFLLRYIVSFQNVSIQGIRPGWTAIQR